MLPKIDVPIYDLKLFSTGKKIRYRPFTVKEEKIFLMANQSEDLKTVIDATKQVINNCVIDDIDIDSLPIFDIENIFLNLRAKSVGEVVSLKYRCNNKIFNDETKEEKNCNHVNEFDLNLNEIKIEKDKSHNKTIELTKESGIVMKYPNFHMVEKFEEDIEDENAILNMVVDCIESVYDKDEVYYTKDFTREEVVDFVESLQTKDLEKIKVFFDTMPKLKKTLNYKCVKCEYEEKIELEGIQSFFA